MDSNKDINKIFIYLFILNIVIRAMQVVIKCYRLEYSLEFIAIPAHTIPANKHNED